MEKVLSVCDVCECPVTQDNGLTWLICGHVFCDRHYPSGGKRCNKCEICLWTNKGIMTNIYQARYDCKEITPTGLSGYNDVRLGLSRGNGRSDIVIQSTLSRFVVGKEYLINVAEVP